MFRLSRTSKTVTDSTLRNRIFILPFFPQSTSRKRKKNYKTLDVSWCNSLASLSQVPDCQCNSCQNFLPVGLYGSCQSDLSASFSRLKMTVPFLVLKLVYAFVYVVDVVQSLTLTIGYSESWMLLTFCYLGQIRLIVVSLIFRFSRKSRGQRLLPRTCLLNSISSFMQVLLIISF